MSVNLLDLLKGQLTSGVVDQLASFTGEKTSTTNSALSAILPSILGSVVAKGATESGAGSLLNMIKDQNMDGSLFDNLSGMLSGGATKNNGLLEMGGNILGMVLGSNQNNFLNMIMKATGLGKGSSSTMMSLVAPMVMNMIGKQVMKNGMNAGGLMKMLSGQKSFLANALPAGMGSLLGFSNNSNSSSQRSTPSSNADSSGGGGGFLKWLLLGLAALLAIGFFGMRTGCGAVDNAAATVTETTEQMADATGDALKSVAGYTKDAAGNLLDASGNIIHKAGDFTVDAAGNIKDATGKVLEGAKNMASDAVETTGDAIKSIANYTKDAAGNLLDASGNIIHKAGEFTVDASGNIITTVKETASTATEALSYKVDVATGNLVGEGGKIILKAGEFEEKDGYYVDKKGNRIGKALGKVKDAIVGAAGKTSDFFKESFSEMFKKKSKTAYALSDIKWEADGHRITNFTKAEVEGLATALKTNPDAKINVYAHTSDAGDNSKKNKTLSKLRAEVVMNMLVALGVDEKQISSKGMSDEDAGKAKSNAIEVLVAE